MTTVKLFVVTLFEEFSDGLVLFCSSNIFLLLFGARLKFPTVGHFYGGKRMSTEEITVDSKGRIQIPKAVRDKVGLRVGEKARLKIEKENIVIMPPISPEDFIKEMEGCIKEGAPVMDPLGLKKMWEPHQK